jgi:hypothetical protein
MRNSLDFSSWRGLLTTLLGLVVVSLVAVGIRLLVMHSVQQRRERANRQINERLKTLIAAYKVLGGSFTGDLSVDPSHLRELRLREGAEAAALAASDRRRRIRDAVEAALSDVVLLGTEEQVRLAARAANDMVEGRPVETAELVVSLRVFIRDVLDLDPIPAHLGIPKQGPVRSKGTAAREGGGAKGGGGGGGGVPAVAEWAPAWACTAMPRTTRPRTRRGSSDAAGAPRVEQRQRNARGGRTAPHRGGAAQGALQACASARRVVSPHGRAARHLLLGRERARHIRVFFAFEHGLRNVERGQRFVGDRCGHGGGCSGHGAGLSLCGRCGSD